ncbi:hypothetical protein G6O69_31360 [Pseudenhygromyxa sp. WMMC2535]|uniref:hypothetical protein n=1 Tax=Pseudenhygromyxa sp. WMMC2535 TaxID=2712867 RepID=UPI0015571409|nr:hypothetical protein [Pseudenhygromyxa sp. WMMC2535]NVB42363.1 hypothetical protein [Pseudenhygromyxa sp. WMMC2535]
MTSRVMTTLLIACGLAGTGSLAACTEVPEVRYRTEHFEIAPDFEQPVCEGTLAYFEEHLSFVESSLAKTVPYGERIRFYWITDDLDSWCSSTALGCYYPGTRVIIGSGDSVAHEIVHAVLNAEAQNSLFLEEGLAELYSGVGSRRPQSSSPVPSELLWITSSGYRYGQLDYNVAMHFMAYLNAARGPSTVRAIANTVVTGAGPPELERALERFTNRDYDALELQYLEQNAYYYPGLREDAVTAIESERWLDVSLRCSEDTTMGPLWDLEPGMYRTLRLELDQTQAVQFETRAPEGVSITVVDVAAERGKRRVVDFHHPKLSGRVEHPELHGDGVEVLQLNAGTHLIVVSRAGYTASEVFLRAEPLGFPRN